MDPAALEEPTQAQDGPAQPESPASTETQGTEPVTLGDAVHAYLEHLGDLGKATSLLVDDSIFIGGADGRIRRFALSDAGPGAELGFPLLNLDRPLLIPASLTIGEISGLLYAADRGNNRVVIFTRSGEVVAQLRADLLTGVRGVVSDEGNRRIYFVTTDALITSALPEIVEP